MAPVNPTIQPVNAQYVGFGSEALTPKKPIEPQGVATNTIRPTGVTQADQSGEYLGKAIGAGISGLGTEIDFAGKAADYVVKQGLDNDLFKAIDAERLRYTASLENALSPKTTPVAGSAVQPDISNVTTQQFGNMVANVNSPNLTNVTTQVPAGAPGGSGAPAELPPATLQSELPSQLNTLSDAMANGKISPTFYYGRLNEVAKQFRQQYPGYREYIDQQIHQITGVTPANAYITSLTNRINTSITSAQTEREHVMTFLRAHIGYPSGAAMIQAYNNGQVSANDVYAQIGKEVANKQRLETRKLENETTTSDVNTANLIQGKNFDNDAASITGAAFSSIQLTSGGGSGQQLTKYLTDVADKKVPPPSDIEAQEYTRMVVARQAMNDAQLWQAAVANGVKDPKQIQEKIDAWNKATWSPLIDALNNKDYGLAHHAANYIQALAADDATRFLGDNKNAEAAAYYRMAGVTKLMGGDPFLQSQIFSAALPAGASRQVVAYMQKGLLQLATQDNRDKTGVTYTVRKLIDDAEGKGITNPQVFDKFVGMVDSIGMKGEKAPQDPVKKNLIHAMFDEGILDKPWQDKHGRDMSPNIFQRMTTDDIRDEVFRLGKSDKSLIDSYTNWVDQSFKIQFSKEINSLRDVQAYPGMKIAWESDPQNNVHRWHLMLNGQDITTSNLGNPIVRQPSPTTHFGRDIFPPEVREAQQVINRLNAGMLPVIGVAKKMDGFDVDAYLLKSFQSAGVALDKAEGNVPWKMIDALIQSRIGAKESEKKWGLSK